MNKTGWHSVATIDEKAWTDGKYLKVEDAFLWQDVRGSWHLLTHRYDYRDGYPPNPNQTMPVLVAGHAYSEDLRTWSLHCSEVLHCAIAERYLAVKGRLF